MKPTDIITIHQATRYLAGVCDFAQKPDGVGYNMLDTAFGHSLADLPSLTPAQAGAACKMLRKYSKQLEQVGITLPAEIDPNVPEITVNCTNIYLAFGGKPSDEMRAWVKGFTGWRWNAEREDKAWSIPLTTENLAAVNTKFSTAFTMPERQAQPAARQQPAQPAARQQPAQPAAAQQQPTSRPAAPKQADVIIEVAKGAILVSFPNYATRKANVEKVKSLPERKWLPDEPGMPWRVPSRFAGQIKEWFGSAQGIEKLDAMVAQENTLRNMANQADGSSLVIPGLKGELYPFQKVGVEFIEVSLKDTGFSPCPLYVIMGKNGDKENAKRNLPTNTEPTSPSEDQSGKGSRERSQGESRSNITRDCERSGMERQGFCSNERSYAQTRCQGETPESTGELSGQQSAEFQGRQRSIRNTDNCEVECPVIARRMAERVSSEDERSYYFSHCANILQSRLCATGSEVSTGDRRDISQQTQPESERQKETGSIGKSWLDCSTLKAQLKKSGAIVADEPGLGKTVQALGYLQLHPELRPAVIVCPASLKANWRREISRWMSEKDSVFVVSGTKTYDLTVAGADILIINWDILAAWQDKIVKLNPAVVIMDEAHFAKNKTAKRSQAAKEIAKHIAKIVLLTGTPITNRPAELYPLLNMVAPKAWSNWWKFAERYCGAYNNGFGWDFSGASNLEELNQAIKPYAIRRRKEQVLTNLPAKRWVNVVVDFDQAVQAEYDLAVAKAEQEVATMPKAAQLALIEKMKQIAVKAKLPGVINWIKEFIETGEKLVVFATHHETIHALQAVFGDATVTVTGETPIKDRQGLVDRFQTDDQIKLFLGNIQAAGVGLTLTAASNVAFVEFAWTGGEILQASDRVHRIGQSESVTVWSLIADGTIDNDIVELLEKKMQIVNTVTDGQSDDIDLFKSIIDRILSKKG